MAVYTVCTRPWAAVYRLFTAALGRVQTVYRAVHGPCTWSVRVPNTAVYAAGTRQNTAGYAACTRPSTYSIHGRAVHGPCTGRAVYTAVFTARVHGRVRTMYTAVHGPSMSRTRPCTRSCTLYTAVFTARVRGSVPCTCTCLRPVYTAVHGRVQTAYGPCTWSVHDPNAAAAPHGRVYSPCRVHGRSRRVRTVYTTTLCIPCIAKVDNRNLLDGYYANPIIHSLENNLFSFSVAVTFWVTM